MGDLISSKKISSFIFQHFYRVFNSETSFHSKYQLSRVTKFTSLAQQFRPRKFYFSSSTTFFFFFSHRSSYTSRNWRLVKHLLIWNINFFQQNFLFSCILNPYNYPTRYWMIHSVHLFSSRRLTVKGYCAWVVKKIRWGELAAL